MTRRSNRLFDQNDQEYRSATGLDSIAGKEGYTLDADYNRDHHLYTFQYRGHGIVVPESEIMWETYPMNLLAEKITEFIKSIDKQIGWNWEPGKQKLGHNEILAQLEASCKEVE